jgi:hypothetical protein
MSLFTDTLNRSVTTLSSVTKTKGLARGMRMRPEDAKGGRAGL